MERKNNITELVFILDRSGSMSGLEADTIGGFNAMIEKQRKEDGDCYVSTVLFDNYTEVLHDRVKLSEIKPMTDKEYTVRGCTALIDALGGAIHHIGNVHKYARPEDVPAHTMFIITTDGMENASHKYTSERVKQMIERQKERYGWEFLFIGANIDAPHVTESTEIVQLIITLIRKAPGLYMNLSQKQYAAFATARHSPKIGAPKSMRITKKEVKNHVKVRFMVHYMC